MPIRLVRSAVSAAVLALLAACAPAERTAGPELSPSAPRLQAAVTPAKIVISQVYGGGGNTGATYRNDFIELFNAGGTAQDVSGWSVQYASATGTSWAVTPIPAGTSIAPGKYLLVQQAQGVGGTQSLPTPEVTGTVAMGAGAGKVALVSGSAALTGSCPTAGVVDFVGFGTTANCFEGSGATPAPSNTNAVLRAGNGCTDANDNAADFAAGTPLPRNSATTANACQTTPAPAVAVTVTAGQSAFQIGQGTTVSVAVTRDGGAVTPSAVAWTATGAGSVTFADATVSPASVTGASAGAVTLTASVTVDGTPYTGSTTVTVTAPPAASSTRVSEFHYDNEGADEGEAIEVEGEAGQSLAGWSLVLYNRTPGSTSAQVYLTIALSGTFANQCSGRGTLTFPVPATPGLQNGTNDGFALVNASNQVVELLSYEGSFTATEGPAAGLTAVNVGVEEGSSTQSTQSLQRGANGAWYGPANETFGRCNPATAPSVAIEGYSFRGGDPIPVGFGELYRFKDVASNTFIRTGVTWSTADPAIATVDALGNVTATAPGETFVTATETATGRTASQRVRVVQFAPVDESVYADELQFGVPTDADPGDDLLVNRATFAASWSAARGQPNWVAYNLEQTHRTGAVDRCDCFAPDPLLPAGTPAVYSSDYDGSGFSRGHMTMSADRTRGALDNAQTFYFTNIIPQTSANNGGPWLQLENYLGSQAASGTKEIFVFAGGAAYSGTLNGAGRVAIPTRTWKVAVILDRNEGIGDVLSPADVEVIAVDMPNTATVPSGNWQDYRTSVDAIEALTGYDLLSALPDPIEQVIEARRAGVQQVAMNLGPEQLSVTGTSVVTVTLFSETGFDASTTNAADLRLVTQTGAVVAPLSRGGVVTTTVRDMNGDGLADRNLSFSMSALRAAGFSQSARQLVLRPAAAPVWEAFDLTPPSVNP